MSRYLFSGGLAGIVASVLFLGLGSRLVMRAAAMLDPDAAGAITENGNVVDEVTLRGTLELIFLEGLFGGFMAGLLWVLVRQWLPRQTRLRIPLAGIVAALLGSFLVVSAENRDFARLDPPAVNAAMFIVIVGLTGCGAAALDRPFERALPSGGLIVAAFGALTLVVGLLSVSFVAQAFLSEDFCGCQDPPRLAAPFLVLSGIASVASWRRWLEPSRWGVEASWQRGLGTFGVLAACFFAALDLADEVGQIV